MGKSKLLSVPFRMGGIENLKPFFTTTDWGNSFDTLIFKIHLKQHRSFVYKIALACMTNVGDQNRDIKNSRIDYFLIVLIKLNSLFQINITSLEINQFSLFLFLPARLQQTVHLIFVYEYISVSKILKLNCGSLANWRKMGNGLN